MLLDCASVSCPEPILAQDPASFACHGNQAQPQGGGKLGGIVQ